MSARFRLVVLVLVALVAGLGWVTNPIVLAPFGVRSVTFWTIHALATGTFTLGTFFAFLWYKEKPGRYRS